MSAIQAHVLQTTGERSFRLVYRYQSVPALAGVITAAGLALLERLPEVENVTLDGRGQNALAESVALIRADEVHAAGLTGEGVVVAVLDTGIDTDHPDLADDLLYERCFLSHESCPVEPHPAEDNNGHGTMVSGVITGAGVIAPIGVAPDAKNAAYKVGFESDWVAALDDIITSHPEVDIVNMSLASLSSCAANSPLTIAISMLRILDVPTFVAAGNFGVKDKLTSPACVTEAFSVGAVYDQPFEHIPADADEVPAFSSSDDTLDLLAPGILITTTAPNGELTPWGIGTSFAAPHAAGVAALMKQAKPDISVDQMEASLKSTGKLITDQLADADPGTLRITPRVEATAALL